MIINPSAHTVIPRVNSYQRCSRHRGPQVMSVPGGTQLWFAVAKVLFVAALPFFGASLWLGKSVTQVSQKLEQVASLHEELVNANILLRAEKAHLFSPEAVGLLAGNQLAIHLPQPGQYKKVKI